MFKNILFIGFFFGILGTFIGGLLGVFINFKSSKTLSCVLEFAAGLMLAVVTFDLLPESFEFGGNFITIVFFIIGIIVALILENWIYKLNSKKHTNGFRTHQYVSFENSSNLITTGILVGIGLALHNFPEGLAIGSRLFRFARTWHFPSFSYSIS